MVDYKKLIKLAQDINTIFGVNIKYKGIKRELLETAIREEAEMIIKDKIPFISIPDMKQIQESICILVDMGLGDLFPQTEEIVHKISPNAEIKDSEENDPPYSTSKENDPQDKELQSILSKSAYELNLDEIKKLLAFRGKDQIIELQVHIESLENKIKALKKEEKDIDNQLKELAA